MTDTPLLMNWTGDALVPHGRWWSKKADEQLVVGERYVVEIKHERSQAAHNFYFAALAEAFSNLPEHIAERIPSVEALRKLALIRTGWRDERSIVCASKAEAQRVAAFIRPLDDFAIVSVNEAMVIVQTAKSQSFKSMGKKAFNDSKNDVLNYAASLIGTTPDALRSSAA